MRLIYTNKRGDKILGRFEAEALNIAYDGNNTLAFIEIAGPITAVRAMWAHLMRARISSSSDRDDPTNIEVEMNGELRDICLASKERYVSSQVGNNMIVMRKGFKKELRTYFVGGDLNTPSEYFLSSFRINHTRFPVLAEWKDELWRMGIQEQLIFPLDSYSMSGLTFWKFTSNRNDDDEWKKIIKEVALGTVSGN